MFSFKALDINLQNNEDDSPLIIAARLNNFEACSLLIKHKANIDIRNILGDDAIKVIPHNSSPELMNMLVTYKSYYENNMNKHSSSSSNNLNSLSKQNTLKGISNKEKGPNK